MADENAMLLLGIPIPSTDPAFLAIVGIHVLFGVAAVITGAVAMLSNKGRGRHSRFGTVYFWCLFGVFATMSALSFIRWAADYHLFVLGALSFAAAIFGRTAAKRRWRQWPRLHLTGVGTSYILPRTQRSPPFVQLAGCSPASRASAGTTASGSSDAATSRSFSAELHRRRRSTDVITSTGSLLDELDARRTCLVAGAFS